MNNDRLIVTVNAGNVTVATRPDWRGMNANTLGYYKLPLDTFAKDRLAGLGVNVEYVESLIVEPNLYCASCGEREGSDYAKHCCQSDNMIEE